MGMVFQYSALFDFLTVEENVAFGLKQHTHMLTDDIKLRVRDLLSSVGLSGNEKGLSRRTFWGNEKSALASPVPLPLILKIILYDEPTAGLDPIMAANISQLILDTKRKRGITSILVTHDMASAFLCADRILMLNQGKIVFSGTPHEARHTNQPLVKAFIRSDLFEENPTKE